MASATFTATRHGLLGFVDSLLRVILLRVHTQLLDRYTSSMQFDVDPIRYAAHMNSWDS